MVQLTVHVSVSGLPVLTIRYRLNLLHKRTKSQNCEFCGLHFLNFWSIPSKKWIYWSKAKLISLYRVDLFTFTPILRHIEWKLGTSIKVSHRLGKHLRIFLKIWLFFLQFAEFNLKAPPYSKTLHYSRISISRALPPFRSICNQDRGHSSHGNVALEKCKISIFLFNFFYYYGRYY